MTDRGETTDFVNDGRSLLASYTGFGLWFNVNVLATNAVVFLDARTYHIWMRGWN